MSMSNQMLWVEHYTHNQPSTSTFNPTYDRTIGGVMVNEPDRISISTCSDDDGDVASFFYPRFSCIWMARRRRMVCIRRVSIQKRNLFFRPLKQEVTIN